MAIGDTVQAGLLKADFSPIERGGAAKGRAYSAIGEGIGNALDKFSKTKQEGEAAEMGINAMIAGMDDQQKEELLSGDSEFSKTYDKFLDGDLTNSQKKTFLGGLVTFNTAQRQNMADQMAKDKFAIEQAEERRRAGLYQRGLDQDEQNQIKAKIYDKFLGGREMVDMPVGGFDPNPLMRGVPQSTVRVPQGEYKGNRFFQTEQGKSDFTSLVDAGIDASDALEMASKREADLLERQPKPMTPEELADYEAKLIANKTNLIKLNELQNPPAPPAPPEPVYMESALDAIDDAITLVGKDAFFNPTAGFGSETAKSIGGSDAADLEAALSTITSAVGFKRLQDMREASPTGGALGSVSERELSQLNAALGSISQKQSPEQLKKNLLKIKDHYQKAVDAINAQRIAYNSGLTFKTQEEALKYIQSQKSSNAIKTDQGDYSIEGLSVEAQ